MARIVDFETHSSSWDSSSDANAVGFKSLKLPQNSDLKPDEWADADDDGSPISSTQSTFQSTLGSLARFVRNHLH